MSFPSTLTGAIDGVTEIVAAHLNNLETKVGVDNSADPNSLDYMLRSSSSSDPGHKHTAGAFTGGFIGDVIFKDPADSIWKPVGLDAAGIVAKTGAQVIAGVKTFSSIPILPASDPTTDNEATRKVYVDTQVALKVAKAGDTMSGNLAMGSNNITGVGTLAAATAQLTNPLAVIYGGTGLNTYAVGDLLYASAADALSKLADVAVGSILISGGVGAAPAWSNTPVLTGDIMYAANEGVRIFGVQRRTTAASPGYELTVKAGGSTDGSTDQDGGTLVLRGGQSTGSGLSRVQIKTAPAGVSGTDRRTCANMIDIEGAEMAFFGASPVAQQALLSDPAADTGALAAWAADINDYLINLGFMSST